MRTIIVGGGASGLYLGSLLSDAVILEKNEVPGRKLLLTGGGRCNVTHRADVEALLPHYNGNRMLLKKVLYKHKPEDIMKRFEALPVPLKEEGDGLIFPVSDRAEDVRNALLERCADIIHTTVTGAEKYGDTFIVHTSGGSIECDRLVIAAGGRAYSATGSDGSGYALAESFGHSIAPLHPSLSPLSLADRLSGSEGITLAVTLRSRKRKVTGDIVITPKGISGPAAMNISSDYSTRDEIMITFLQVSKDDLRTEPKKELKNVVPLPSRLLSSLFGPLADKKTGNLSKAEMNHVIETLTAFRTEASALSASAMVTAGGVQCSEINPDTMESKLVKGLYFVGEVVDVDGECGGYNLTWAFSSAYSVYKAIIGQEPPLC